MHIAALLTIDTQEVMYVSHFCQRACIFPAFARYLEKIAKSHDFIPTLTSILDTKE